MAVTTVYQSSQGRVGNSASGTLAAAWASAKGTNATTGNSVGSTSTNDNFGSRTEAARGGAFLATNYRAYFYFDLSSITTTITGITFTARGGTNSTNQNGDWIAVRANQDADFGTIATSDYTLVYNSSAVFTNYSQNVASWSYNADNTVTLNPTAVSKANSEGELCVGLMNYTYDYDGAEVEESIGDIFNSLSFVNSGTTRARLTVTHADAPSGYGNEVNNIIPASISKVLGIATADISKVTGV
jgi:hypothetical protein